MSNEYQQHAEPFRQQTVENILNGKSKKDNCLMNKNNVDKKQVNQSN